MASQLQREPVSQRPIIVVPMVFTHSTGLEIVISLLSTPNSNHTRGLFSVKHKSADKPLIGPPKD